MSHDEFTALLEPHLSRAYATALQLTRNAADAEDLVQEAALLAYRGFATFQRDTNFRAWFLRILTNAFLSARRRQRPEDHAVALDDLPNAAIQRGAAAAVGTGAAGGLQSGDVAQTVMQRLTVEDVTAAIAALPEEFRTVATLYFLDDASYRDIAGTLGIPVGTVRSRLHRGRALLQRRLWQLAEDYGLVRVAAAGGTE